MESKEVNRRNTRVGTRVQAFTGRTGTVTKVADRTTGQRFAVKVRWDYNGYEGWVSNPGYNLTVK